MPNMIGGLADKFGNRYESRWLVELMIRLSREEILSLTHERVDIDGIDLQVGNINGSIEFHQCKSRNAGKDTWTLSDLNSQHIFSYARKCLDAGENHFYKLISPRPCDAMETLISRAKNSSGDPLVFYEHQIKAIHGKNNADIEKSFLAFQKYMGLTPDDTPQSIAKAIDYLSRMEFIPFADTEHIKSQLISRLSDIFNTNAKSVYDIFANYTIENDRLDHSVTIAEINSYLAEREIFRFDLANHTQVWPRIQELNQEFFTSFTPIQKSLLHRQETDAIYHYLIQNTSVVLHGKAGSGKSGCVLELMTKLEKAQIPYLALKLDKRTPEKSAAHYGADLNLPASPVLCLSRMAQKASSVLILDQLDAVRWTAQHTRTALEVCKELVAQVERLNSDSYIGGRISILFVCRTFDVETDNRIKSLFTLDKQQNNRTQWEKIEIGNLAEEDVLYVVGAMYNQFTPKFQKLLRNVGNLYIWSRLDEQNQKIEYASAYRLILKYWEQFEQHCDEQGISHYELLDLKTTLVNAMRKSPRMSVPVAVFRGHSSKVLGIAISEGIIINNHECISFVHQSFYDAFAVETMVNELYAGQSLLDLLGEKEKQTPPLRYQLQMLLQVLADSDQAFLTRSGNQLLDSDCVRYYMKYVFWEVVGQLTSIDAQLMTLIESRLNEPAWSSAILDTVIFGHPYYVNHFIDNGLILSWLSNEKTDTAIRLLWSVNTVIGDRIAELLTPYAFQNVEMDRKIYESLCRKPEDDTDRLFELRLKLLTNNSDLLNDFVDYITLAKKNTLRTARLLELLLMVDDTTIDSNAGEFISSDFDLLTHLGNTIPVYILDVFMPIIEKKTMGEYYLWSPLMKGWSAFDVMPRLGRNVTRMAITAGQQLAEMQPDKFYSYFLQYADSKSSIINEILLYSLPKLPAEYADMIIEWLISDSCSHMVEETGKYEKTLDATRMLIKKYSRLCSDVIFTRIEDALLNYHDKFELATAQRRFNHNRAALRNELDGENFIVYWPYWGMTQAYLLPALDARRTSHKTKQLIRVLQRRFEGYDLGGMKSRITTRWGVSSPIPDDISNQFSDKQWLRIIKNQKLQSKEFQIKEYRKHERLESSNEMFAQQYTRSGLKKPERFVALALKFPVDVDRYYIQAVWEIASTTEAPKDADNWNPASFDLIRKVTERFLTHHDADEYNMCCRLCRLVRNRAREDWSEAVVNRLIFLATDYNDSYLDNDNNFDLGTASLNSVRGAASYAIAALLWEKPDLYTRLSTVIGRLVQDEHAVVRQAILEAVIAVYNIDKRQSVQWFFALVNSDERIARHYRAKELLYHIWVHNKPECTDLIRHLFFSEDEKSSEFGAFIATNLYIVYDGDVDSFQQMIFSGELTEAQIKGCANVVTHLLESSHCHDRAIMILEELMNYPALSVDMLRGVFYRDSFLYPKDCELMIKIVSSNPNKTFRLLSHYIREHDLPVSNFIDIIMHLCSQCIQNSENTNNLYKDGYYNILHELPILISTLYDQAIGDEVLTSKCLDMWDSLYQSNMGNVRALTQQIMDR